MNSEEIMGVLTIVFAGISAFAALVSAVYAILTKKEVSKYTKTLINSTEIKNNGKISVNNTGDNTGSVVGYNSGEIK